MDRSKYYLTVSGNLKIVASLFGKKGEKVAAPNWQEKLSDEQRPNLQTWVQSTVTRMIS